VTQPFRDDLAAELHVLSGTHARDESEPLLELRNEPNRRSHSRAGEGVHAVLSRLDTPIEIEVVP